MMREELVFGPIHSRRLGSSLGINLLPRKGKLCNFDCIYCECGWNKDGRTDERLPDARELSEALARESERKKTFDIASYSSRVFGMFAGEEVRVKLRFRDDMVGVLLDRFGTGISIHPAKGEKGWSETHVDVALSDQFLGWIFSLGSAVRIVGPKEVTERFASELKTLGKLYSQKKK